MRIVKLRDAPLAFFVDQDKHKATPYGEPLISAAYAAMVARDLSYNVQTGVTRDRDGWLARFVCSEDIPTDYTDQDVWAWSLSGHVRNSASRLSRGFAA